MTAIIKRTLVFFGKGILAILFSFIAAGFLLMTLPIIATIFIIPIAFLGGDSLAHYLAETVEEISYGHIHMIVFVEMVLYGIFIGIRRLFRIWFNRS